MASTDRVRKETELTIRVEPRGRECLVRAIGEIDIASAKAFEEELTLAITSESAVVLDLEQLSFIDTTGLRCLLSATKLSSMNGGQLHIVNPSATVKRAIELTGLEGSLPLVD
jgi:anti-anti-sigma factor